MNNYFHNIIFGDTCCNNKPLIPLLDNRRSCITIGLPIYKCATCGRHILSKYGNEIAKRYRGTSRSITFENVVNLVLKERSQII